MQMECIVDGGVGMPSTHRGKQSWTTAYTHRGGMCNMGLTRIGGSVHAQHGACTHKLECAPVCGRGGESDICICNEYR